MITSISNNFGCGPIQMKDYQDDKMVILNGKFTVIPTNDDYRNCEVLEVKVPDLKIGRSAETFCYITTKETMAKGTYYEYEAMVATVCKTWIKDRNTICIEKFGVYDDLEEFTIWLCGMYPVVGQRGEVKVYDRTRLQYKALQTTVSPSDLVCVVEEGWTFLHFYYYNAYGIRKGTPIEAELVNFPTDVDVEIPILGGNQQSNHGGCYWTEAGVKDGKFLVPEPEGYMGSTGYAPFVMAYLVRG